MQQCVEHEQLKYDRILLSQFVDKIMSIYMYHDTIVFLDKNCFVIKNISGALSCAVFERCFPAETVISGVPIYFHTS